MTLPAYKNHLKIGYNLATHRGKEVASSLNSLKFKEFVNSLDELDFSIGVIPPGFEHRADKISELFYETPTLDWLICWTNNISDPFQQLNIGDQIKIVDL
tara:strand:- start:1171 stop:1470 length:300 start_codon:yes stop_codon:yes gene_type:complete